MKKLTCLLLIILVIGIRLPAQQFYFPGKAVTDSTLLSTSMLLLAKDVMRNYKEDNQLTYLNNLMRLQIIAGQHEALVNTIHSYRSKTPAGPNYPELTFIQYELYAKARMNQEDPSKSFSNAFSEVFRQSYRTLDDKAAVYISTAFITRNGVHALQSELNQSLTKQIGKDSISLNDALALARSYSLYHVFKTIEPLAKNLIVEDDNRRYIIEDSLLIKTRDGAGISAIVVRKRSVLAPQPSVLVYTIYAEEFNYNQAKTGAAYGYASIVANTRGKRLSRDEINPYEHETQDVNEVIDWISRQAWSNGKVGMYGGSYNGYTQWAALKNPHPALKTIVPYVAAIPGLGLPMENNVFISPNYGWAFYVSNNRYLDDSIYYDPGRWDGMINKWYSSGVAYRKLDSVDGIPNRFFQRWLKHPGFDKYWQDKIPYKNEYARINIPVLSITGYYDDGQISAIHYLKEHYKYNRNANHYLVIGPYDHFSAQRGPTPVLRGYNLDPVALINPREITFEWLDHILKDGKKPSLLKDRINYQVMGSNEWKHSFTWEKMNQSFLTFYLSDERIGDHYRLVIKKPLKPGFLLHVVDLADRTTTMNDYYPDPIIRDSVDITQGLSFITEPFTEPFSINGSFLGELKASINKKDMDIGLVLYEVMPDGRYFHLSYFIGRASYAQNMEIRKLLIPGKKESIPFERTRMVSRQLSKGSRLLIILNINKNQFAQVNYGTGKDVSNETIADAKEPLRIKWYTDSFIKIPVSK